MCLVCRYYIHAPNQDNLFGTVKQYSSTSDGSKFQAQWHPSSGSWTFRSLRTGMYLSIDASGVPVLSAANDDSRAQFSVGSSALCAFYGGVSRDEFCCASSCGTCGGTGCGGRDGGADSCCTSSITSNCGSPPCRSHFSLQSKATSKYVHVAQYSLNDPLATADSITSNSAGWEIIKDTTAQCPPGFVGPDGSPLVEDKCSANCEACSDGKYKVASGSAVCVPCPAGTTTSALAPAASAGRLLPPWTFRPLRANEFTGKPPAAA